MTDLVTAVDMARNAGIDPKKFRRALRKEKEVGAFSWHVKHKSWSVLPGSPEHKEMLRVLKSLI